MADWKLEVIWEGRDMIINNDVRLVEAIDPEGDEGFLTPELRRGGDAMGVPTWVDIDEPVLASRVLATGVYYALKGRDA